MDLISTVYVSSAVKPFTPAELVDLLRVARDNNARAGLTGMLLYHEGNFMQMLEGAPAAVDALLAKLRDDPRHTRVQVLLRKPIAARTCGEWQMAFRDTRSLSPAELSEVSQFLRPTFSPVESGEQASAAPRLLEIFRAKLR